MELYINTFGKYLIKLQIEITFKIFSQPLLIFTIPFHPVSYLAQERHPLPDTFFGGHGRIYFFYYSVMFRVLQLHIMRQIGKPILSWNKRAVYAV